MKIISLIFITIYICSCATHTNIHTQYRPQILNHANVSTAACTSPCEMLELMKDAKNKKEVFGFCMPVRQGDDMVHKNMCTITELGEVYVVIDNSKKNEEGRFILVPAIWNDNGKIKVPSLNTTIVIE